MAPGFWLRSRRRRWCTSWTPWKRFSQCKIRTVQLGLASGEYKVTAEKDKVGSAPTTVRVSLSNPGSVELVIGKNAAAATAENVAKNAELKKLFDEGVAAANAGRHDEAIEKFTK